MDLADSEAWSALLMHQLKRCMAHVAEEFVVNVPYVCCKLGYVPNLVCPQFYLRNSSCFESL